MKFRGILAIGMVILFGATLLGGVHASTSTSGLPMPYGSRDLTHMFHMDKFYGIRINSNQWYTFIVANDGNDYDNSAYSYGDINNNGVYGNKNESVGIDYSDINYYNFATVAIAHPSSGTGDNKKYGVEGTLGVSVESYNGGSDMPHIRMNILTQYIDRYIKGVTEQEIKSHSGVLTESEYQTSNTENPYLFTIIHVDKINAATDKTEIDWDGVNGGNNPGFNAYPHRADKIGNNEKYHGNVSEKIFKYEVKYLFNYAMNKATYGGWGLANNVLTVMEITANDMKYYTPSPQSQGSPVNSGREAYYDWAATTGGVVQSSTFNRLSWYIGSDLADGHQILGLKIWAEFWYAQPSDVPGEEEVSKQTKFTTKPIYIYVVPRGLGVGIPIQPLPAGYGGSGVDEKMHVYIDPPTTFTAVVNTKYTMKTVDVGYGFSAYRGLKSETIYYDFYCCGAHHYVSAGNGKIAKYIFEFKSLGDYQVKVRASLSKNGPWSPWSVASTIHVVDAFRTGPKAPYAGSTTFYTDSSGEAKITFKTSASTYSGSQIKYVFYWGDGHTTTTGWHSSYSSVSATHNFSPGTYYVRVKAIASTGISKYSSSTKITVESSGGGGGGSSGGSCVDPYTPILMGDGTYKLAMNIQVGDEVMTYNFSTGQYEPGTVEKITITHETKEYVINGVLRIAKDQEVWTSRGWVEAQNLTTSDWVYNAYTGRWMQVYSIYVINENIEMYDFHISKNQNYVAWMYLLEDWGGIHAC